MKEAVIAAITTSVTCSTLLLIVRIFLIATPRIKPIKIFPTAHPDIPYLVTKSGVLIAIALETVKEKVLILNSYYNDGRPTNNGPGSYLASREPTVTIQSTEFNGHVAQY